MRRKDSNQGRDQPTAYPTLMSPSPKPFWSKLFPPPPSKSSLPPYGNNPPTRRPFYDPSGPRGVVPPVGGPVALLKGVLLRPLFILSRRGPLLPLILVTAFLTIFLTYSTRPAAQTVKNRVQGAVGPYVPQRAVDAVEWGGRGGQALYGAVNEAGKAALDRVIRPMGSGGRGKAKKLLALPPPRKDSRMLIVEGQPHPIPALIQRGKDRWEELKARQSKTFAEAVAEYERRNSRKPPKGFDQWQVNPTRPPPAPCAKGRADSGLVAHARRYAFAKAHKVLMIDEFDLIDADLLHFRAFRPSSFRARVQQIFDTMDVNWKIRIEGGRIFREGDLANHDRAKGVESLISRFAHALPDMSIAYNGHDGARTAIAAEERERLQALVRKGGCE